MSDTRASSTNGSAASVGSTTPQPRKRAAKLTKPVAAARKVIDEGTDAIRHQAANALEAGTAVIDGAPLTALAGAIALGAVTAALLPNSARELQALGPVGDRVRAALDEAFAAAKTAGAEQLTARGLTAAATTSGIGALVGSIVKAVVAANGAANETLRPAQQLDVGSDAPQGS